MSAVEAPARPLTVALLELLNALGRGAFVRLVAESRDLGVRRELTIGTPMRGLNSTILDRLEAGFEALSASPATITAPGELKPSWLTALTVTWKPRTAFDAKRLHHVPDGAAAEIRDALATVPTPSALIDGGPAIVAVWFLAEPLALPADADRARALRIRLAERLGADVLTAAEDLAAASIPLPGTIVRNWNRDDVARFADFDPSAVYNLHDLEAAVAPSRTKKGARA